MSERDAVRPVRGRRPGPLWSRTRTWLRRHWDLAALVLLAVAPAVVPALGGFNDGQFLIFKAEIALRERGIEHGLTGFHFTVNGVHDPGQRGVFFMAIGFNRVFNRLRQAGGAGTGLHPAIQRFKKINAIRRAEF